MIQHVVFLLEEPSARDALDGLMPRLLMTPVEVHYLVFEGKQDLERRMERRLRHWLRPDTRFIVLRDQDSGDCKAVKRALAQRCEAAGRGRSSIVRVACRELESFFVGDWEAVAQAYGKPALARLARAAKYRDPDRLGSPFDELRRHVADYQKRDGARRIAPLLDPARNQSRSFRALVDAVRTATQP